MHLVPGMIDSTCVRWWRRAKQVICGLLRQSGSAIWRELRSAGKVYLRLLHRPWCRFCAVVLPAPWSILEVTLQQGRGRSAAPFVSLHSPTQQRRPSLRARPSSPVVHYNLGRWSSVCLGARQSSLYAFVPSGLAWLLTYL